MARPVNPVPKKVGRKRIDLPIKRIETLAAAGLSKREIALCIGVNPITFRRREIEAEEAPDDHPDSVSFVEAYERGRARGHAATATKILALAAAGDTRMLELRARCQYGWKDRQVVEHEGMPEAHAPSVTVNVATPEQKAVADCEQYGQAFLRSLERQAAVRSASGEKETKPPFLPQ